MSLNPELRTALEGTLIAHVATVLPDGAPHTVPVWVGTHDQHVVIMTGPGSRKARNLRRDPRVAMSLTPPDNPFAPIVVRGRVVEWLDGTQGWRIIDDLAHKYIGAPYSRDQDRVALLIEVDHYTLGM